MVEINNTPEIIRFLTSTLTWFLEYHEFTKKWNKYKIADFITSSDKITGSVSDTTLGRFLNSDHKQQASISTLRMVAEFLVAQKVISERLIKALSHSESLLASVALSEFYETKLNKPYKSFCESLSGCYHSLVKQNNYILQSTLVINFYEQSTVLIVREVVQLYKTDQNKQLDVTHAKHHLKWEYARI